MSEVDLCELLLVELQTTAPPLSCVHCLSPSLVPQGSSLTLLLPAVGALCLDQALFKKVISLFRIREKGNKERKVKVEGSWIY